MLSGFNPQVFHVIGGPVACKEAGQGILALASANGVDGAVSQSVPLRSLEAIADFGKLLAQLRASQSKLIGMKVFLSWLSI